MLISIDRYYDSEFYNKCLQALANNKVPVKQFISSTSYKWFLDVPSLPVMLNFEQIQENEKRYLLSKSIAVFPSDQYKLYRRASDYGTLNPFMIRADYMLSDKQYACFFNIKSFSQGHDLSKIINDKVYYLGKYYNNKYRIALCFDPSVRTVLSSSEILYEKSPSVSWIQTELDLNYKVFMQRDYLMKFTRTPYFLNRRFETPNYYGEFQRRFFTF